jgi:hypothetical protein
LIFENFIIKVNDDVRGFMFKVEVGHKKECPKGT